MPMLNLVFSTNIFYSTEMDDIIARLYELQEQRYEAMRANNFGWAGH